MLAAAEFPKYSNCRYSCSAYCTDFVAVLQKHLGWMDCFASLLGNKQNKQLGTDKIWNHLNTWCFDNSKTNECLVLRSSPYGTQIKTDELERSHWGFMTTMTTLIKLANVEREMRNVAGELCSPIHEFDSLIDGTLAISTLPSWEVWSFHIWLRRKIKL